MPNVAKDPSPPQTPNDNGNGVAGIPTGLYPKNLLVDGFMLQAGQMGTRKGESTADIMHERQKARKEGGTQLLLWTAWGLNL